MNLRIIPPPHRTSDLILALRVHLGRTEVQPGCIHCSISQDAQQQNVITYQEEWNSWEDLEKQIRSDRFYWILELMEQSSNTPELTFNDVKETRGIEYVRQLRIIHNN